MIVIEDLLNVISAWVWGPFMLCLLLGTGIYLTIGLKIIPWRKIPAAFSLLLNKSNAHEKGQISAFQALMTSLSATIGTGNIVGVATAISLGGPGAIFWMWVTAFFGMATKYAEALLAVKFREIDNHQQYVGGPMYYIRNGLGCQWNFLAILFAMFASIASFGIGNMVQANSVAESIEATFNVPKIYTGIIVMLLTSAVIIGGVTRIAKVAAKMVPIMSGLYITACLSVIIINYEQIPGAFALIMSHAFTGTAAAGGFVGTTFWAAIRFGVARGVFSNEAGLGSAPIAHAAAKTDEPVKQGLVAMLGTFIDTLIICTMTALVILVTDSWISGASGPELASMAFARNLFEFGRYLVVISLAVFAFSTLLGWSYYGERCVEFLLGKKSIWPFRFLWLIVIPLGALGELKLVWLIAEIMNALMAVPNLIALVLLSTLVFKTTKQYFHNPG